MNKPLLTVCLITYNQAPYIKKAIDTILEQKVNFPWEIVIADDYSTDGTRETVLEYKKQHPDLIKLILQKKNVGPERNWLDLMAYPKTKYVLYADGDDYFIDTTKLQKQVDFLEAHKDFSICFHPVKVIYEDGSRGDEVFPTPKQRFNKNVLGLKDLLTNNFIQTNSAIYRWRFIDKDVKNAIPKGISPGDWFLHILHADTGKIGFIDKKMSVYRKHPGGLWWDSYKDRDIFMQKYGLLWLKFHEELLRIYGSNPEYRQVIGGSIINLLNSFVKVDEKHHEGLFKKALTLSPEVAELYIGNLQAQINDLHNHADEQAKLIQHYLELSNQLRAENEKLNNKGLIKLEHAVSRQIKRKATK